MELKALLLTQDFRGSRKLLIKKSLRKKEKLKMKLQEKHLSMMIYFSTRKAVNLELKDLILKKIQSQKKIMADILQV